MDFCGPDESRFEVCARRGPQAGRQAMLRRDSATAEVVTIAPGAQVAFAPTIRRRKTNR